MTSSIRIAMGFPGQVGKTNDSQSRCSQHLRAIPDKNQKILNGAGHSWSQIFMKLSEHVKVVTLSKYSTLFFSQHARLPWQPDTKILAFKSAK